MIALLTLAYNIGRDVRDRRKAQAMKIACWLGTDKPLNKKIGDNKYPITIYNASELPIYDVVVSADIVNQENFETQMLTDTASYVQIVPPGIRVVLVPWQRWCMHTQFGGAITFRDCAGNWWRRDAVGNIKRSKKSNIDLYGLSRPVDSAELY